MTILKELSEKPTIIIKLEIMQKKGVDIMFTIPVKIKTENEFLDFIKKFQKIGEIEEETFLMGVKCFDSDGYLSRIKLFFVTDEKEADAVLFNDKIDNYCILKSYGRFKDNLKDEKEKLREEFLRK